MPRRASMPYQRRVAVFIGASALVVAFFAFLWPEASSSEPSDLEAPGAAEAGERALRSGSAPETAGGGAPFRAHAAPPERRGGTLHGVVRWDDGTAVGGAEVALVDENGEVIADALTDAEGNYALEDKALAGSEIQVTEPLGDAHQRDLSPLRSGENRTFDVVLGEQREVVGWVLDPLGDPQPGITVLLSWERAESQWRAVTDAGGSFTFVDVPSTPLRVTADGGDLGIASARVAQTDQTRREVTLVLEPVGTIFVRATPEVAQLGQVVVRCFAATAHGPDGLWNDDMRPPEVLYDDGSIGEPVEIIDDPMLPPAESLETIEAPTEPEPSVDEIETMLGSALREWDTTDPEGSLTRMAITLATGSSSMAQQLRNELGRDHPELAGATLEDLARAAAQKAIRDEPMILDMMGLAASKVREGARPMDAFMAAGSEVQRHEPPEPLAEVEAAVDVEEAEPEIAPEGESLEYDVGEGEIIGESEMVGEGEIVDDYYAQLERIRQETGVEQVEGIGEARSLVATGRFLEPIAVRGSFEYQVSVRHPDGFEIVCGTVFVAAGEEVEVMCGKGGPAIVSGRVVDTAGAPIEGAVIEAFWGETVTAATDRNGRYELSIPLPSAQLLTIGAHDANYTLFNALKRNQNVRPGVRTEVPDIVARRAEELPVYTLTEPYGGVGASIGLSSEGIVVTGLFDEGPLALAGVESGDTILRIGEELGASLSIEDALLMLRGEAGTEVDLTLRSSEGELYELAVTRGLVNPSPDGPVDDPYSEMPQGNPYEYAP